MKTRSLLVLAVAFTLLMGGTAPSPLQRPDIQHDLAALTKRGFTYRMLDNDVIELIDPVSGEKHHKTLREPSEASLRSWAAARGVPMLEIDPNMVDTSLFSGWYSYWATVPLANDVGIPLVVGDVNHNGYADVYGAYLDTLSTDYAAKVYELDTLGRSLQRYQYVPRPGVSRQIVDVDSDSLVEVAWSIAGVVAGYEQPSRDSLPLYRAFSHDRHYHNWDPGYTGIFMGHLDDDSLTDFLYQGTGPDPHDTNLAISKTYVAEYDPSLGGFVRVWSIQFYPGSGVAGFSVGDFDNDAKTEFVASHATGRVYVAKNTGNNQYALVWQDSTPYVNFYYHGSGDVDNDGKIEFFTGATMSNGNWVLMYEADGNNMYSAKFLFHLLSGGVFAEPIYTTVDMDGDGKLELAMLVGADLYIFKSDRDNHYSLWYLKREDTADGVAFYDFNHDGLKDMIISKFGVNSQGRGWTYADVYLASKIVSVKEQHPDRSDIQLFPNYPNPFNPETSIEYVLHKRATITLTIYNILGQPVSTLVHGEEDAGRHQVVWDATGMSSGVYICQLEVPGISLTKKLLLVR